MEDNENYEYIKQSIKAHKNITLLILDNIEIIKKVVLELDKKGDW